MYIFSMPGGEDLRLAGYYRYNRTIVIFSGGATVISLCMLLNQIKGSLKCFIYSILCCIACIGSFHFSGLPHYEYYKAHYSTGSTLSTAFREKLQPLIDQYGIPTGARVIIFLDDGINDASGLLSYIAKYSLFTSVADTKWITNMNDSVNLNSFDYLIAIGESDDMTNFMREQFGTEKRVIDLSTINEM